MLESLLSPEKKQNNVIYIYIYIYIICKRAASGGIQWWIQEFLSISENNFCGIRVKLHDTIKLHDTSFNMMSRARDVTFTIFRACNMDNYLVHKN